MYKQPTHEEPDTGFIEAYGQVSKDDNKYPRGERPEFVHMDEIGFQDKKDEKINLTELTQNKNYYVEDDDGYID